MSEFKGKIAVGVTVSIIAALGLAVAFAAFTPTFQATTSQSSILSSSSGQDTYSSVTSSQHPETSGTGSATLSTSSTSTTGVTVIVIPLGAGANPSEPGGLSNPIFVPSQLTVVVGVNNTIAVVNEDNESHWFVFTSLPDGASTAQLVNTPQLAPGQNFTFTLTAPGVYDFEDAWKPVWPHGSITVIAPGQQTNSTSMTSTCTEYTGGTITLCHTTSTTYAPPTNSTTSTSTECTISAEGTGFYVTVLTDSGQPIQGAQVTGVLVDAAGSSTCTQDIGTYVTNSTGSVLITPNIGSYYQLSISALGNTYSVNAPIEPMTTTYVTLSVPSGNVTITEVFEGGCQTSSQGTTCPG